MPMSPEANKIPNKTPDVLDAYSSYVKPFLQTPYQFEYVVL